MSLLVAVPLGEVVMALLLLPAPVWSTNELELLELLSVAALFDTVPELSADWLDWLRNSTSFFLSR